MTHRILKDEDGTKTDTHATSGSNTRSIVLIVILVLVVLGLVSFFLFKLWRKKKREEQYARNKRKNDPGIFPVQKTTSRSVSKERNSRSNWHTAFSIRISPLSPLDMLKLYG
ncbi:hypothetical protein FH972_004471 [Carpinus fangiana]|uniref:Uncharacterized protein n=1 Tax=Carpinus fangiana TaxID=176857 RepID=A0A5N6QLN2_9ROSI|nr:hypothetical protein FH972_004471 [Carpinus fangiana]